MKWLAWGILLFTTNFFGTLTSRARNTPSYAYHGTVACLNHATWFMATVMFVGAAVNIEKLGDWKQAVLTGAFYTACSTASSIAAHFGAIHFLERDGKRRVGSY